MKRWLLPLFVAAGCNGPPAPDAAVCEDLIHRLCIQPLCTPVAPLVPTGDCETVLLAQTGCGSSDFTFSATAVSRDRFLSCRLPLLRAGASEDTPPNCDDVQDVFNTCQDVIVFLQGNGDGGT